MSQLPEHLGYRYGLRQPATTPTLHLTPVATLDFDRLDAWLEEAFGIRPEAQPAPSQPAEAAPALAMAWRILLVSRSLLQAARIPAFDAGRVLQAWPDGERPGLWQVRVAVPIIDLFPARCIMLALDAAIKAVLWGEAHCRAPRNIDELYAQIEEQLLRPLHAMGLSGISTLPILGAAHRLGIPFRHLGAGVYQLGWGGNARIMDRSSVDADSAIGSRLAQKKHWTAQLLRTAGLPAPEHFLVAAEQEAQTAASRLGWPLVVKPADRDRGEGVTVGIDDEQKLLRAFKAAAALSKLVLVEREVPGLCYRLMVANGRLLYALRRKPREVVGDGRHSIAELVRLQQAAAEKAPPWSRDKPLALDADALATLAGQGLQAHSVPAAGQGVALRRFESTAWGGVHEDVSASVHPANIEIVERATRLLGFANAGIDIITTDIARPWHETGAIINEVNYAPSFGATAVAQSKMADYLRVLMGGDGRIPVEAFVGGDGAMQAARTRQREHLAAGMRCFLTSHAETLDAQGAATMLPRQGLFARSLALQMNREVEGLLLVIQTDELLHAGLPFDRFTRIIDCGGELASANQAGQTATEGARQQLLALLGDYAAARSG